MSCRDWRVSHLPFEQSGAKSDEKGAQLRTLLAVMLRPRGIVGESHANFVQHTDAILSVQERGRVDPGNSLGLIRSCPKQPTTKYRL